MSGGWSVSQHAASLFYSQLGGRGVAVTDRGIKHSNIRVVAFGVFMCCCCVTGIR